MPKMFQVMFSEESRGWFLLTQNSVFSAFSLQTLQKYFVNICVNISYCVVSFKIIHYNSHGINTCVL